MTLVGHGQGSDELTPNPRGDRPTRSMLNVSKQWLQRSRRGGSTTLAGVIRTPPKDQRAHEHEAERKWSSRRHQASAGGVRLRAPVVAATDPGRIGYRHPGHGLIGRSALADAAARPSATTLAAARSARTPLTGAPKPVRHALQSQQNEGMLFSLRLHK